MKRTTTLLIMMLMASISWGQAKLVTYHEAQPSIEVTKLNQQHLRYQHTVVKGNTAYSLAKLYRCSLADIYKLNNLSPNTPLSIGQVLNINIPSEVLYVENHREDFNQYEFIPVYYKVRKKETLYSIAKTHLGQNVETFMKRNGLRNSSLDIGQQLLIGWLPTKEMTQIQTVSQTNAEVISEPKPIISIGRRLSPEEAAAKTKRDTAMLNRLMPTAIFKKEQNEEISTDTEMDTMTTVTAEPVKPNVVTRRTRGIGIWERDSKVNSMSVVLHHTAKKGSYITLHNPQLKLSTTAKVIGRIPMGTYPSDVSVIMSKKVAETLGALDTRFMVDLTFEEERK